MIVRELIEQLNRINPELEVNLYGSKDLVEILVKDGSDHNDCLLFGAEDTDGSADVRYDCAAYYKIVYSEIHKFYQDTEQRCTECSKYLEDHNAS